MRKPVSFAAAVLVLMAVLLSACASKPDVATAGVEQVVFSPDDWPQTLSADLYRPTGEGPFAAVLLVHGGGWASRSRDDMTAIAQRLQAEGWLVLNIDHRFAPEYRFPDQLHDLQVAMHWLHDNAAGLNLDRQRISAFGYSSGAHLVSLLALVAGQGGELDQPYGGELTRPYAVVAGGTPTDLRKYRGGKLVPQFLGGDQGRAAAAYRLASPVTHVTADAPPFFLFHANRDRTVPLDHATDFVVALEQAGGCVILQRQTARGHITGFFLRGAAMERAVAFLRSPGC